MIVSLEKILTKRFHIRSLIFVGFFAAYVALTFAIFFLAVIPSYVDGTTSKVFAVDSTQYVYMADSLREGRNEPWVLTAMYSFPNSLWTPVGLSLLLKSAFLVMLANYTALAISLFLLKRSFRISVKIFIVLLLINPMTTTSLLCVNKEIFDLFNMSLFLYSRAKRSNWLVLVALGFALINRFEICAVMVAFLLAEGRLNPLRENRVATLLLLIAAISFVMPFWGGSILAQRFEEAQSLKVISWLDIMQIHYLYVFAVVPKIAVNLIGYLIDVPAWFVPTSWIYIMIFSNVSYAILILMAVRKRLFSLHNDLIYLGAVGSVIVAQSLVPQPRYFYFLYILLCLRLAQGRPTNEREQLRTGGGVAATAIPC